MSDSYTVIAAYYDRFNAADYDGFCDFYEAMFARYGKVSHGEAKEHLLLDLACGTGSVALRMARRGYDVIGIDLSPDMLSLAGEQARRQKQSVLFLQQDMRSFELYGTVDAALCCLDSLNYLLTTEDLARTFAQVHNYLDPNGLWIFDLRTPAYLEALGERDFVSEADGVVFQWQNRYHKKSKICDFDISFFVEETDGRYRRLCETQREKAHAHRTVCRLLQETGFELLEVVSDTDGNPMTEQDDRRIYVCKCIK